MKPRFMKFVSKPCKPCVIEAIQWKDEYIESVFNSPTELLSSYALRESFPENVVKINSSGHAFVTTIHGDSLVSDNDWIVKDGQHYYPVREDIFGERWHFHEDEACKPKLETVDEHNSRVFAARQEREKKAKKTRVACPGCSGELMRCRDDMLASFMLYKSTHEAICPVCSIRIQLEV